MTILNTKNGQVMIIAIVFLAVILILSSSLFARVANYVGFGSRTILQEQAIQLAEAGIDYAVWYLNESAGTNPDPNPTAPIAVGTTGEFIIQITDKSPSLKTITSTGYIPNSTNPRVKKTIKIDVLIDSQQHAFHYAVQLGEGGIDMENFSIIHGTAYSNSYINGSGNSLIDGDAYAVTTISSPDPEITGEPYPGAEEVDLPTVNYDYWRTEAEAGGTETCPCEIDTSGDIGPKKYDGDLSITGNAYVVMNGPVYVTGNFSMSLGGTTVKLNDDFGSFGTVFIVDGTVNLTQGGNLEPTNTDPKGYILLITTSTSDQAMKISQSGATAIFYALVGGAELSQSANVTGIVAKKLLMKNRAELTYDTGLAGGQFKSDSGGSWQIKKGTYKFTSSP